MEVLLERISSLLHSYSVGLRSGPQKVGLAMQIALRFEGSHDIIQFFTFILQTLWNFFHRVRVSSSKQRIGNVSIRCTTMLHWAISFSSF